MIMLPHLLECRRSYVAFFGYRAVMKCTNARWHERACVGFFIFSLSHPCFLKRVHASFGKSFSPSSMEGVFPGPADIA